MNIIAIRRNLKIASKNWEKTLIPSYRDKNIGKRVGVQTLNLKDKIPITKFLFQKSQ